jgi:hypothetical protein
VEEQKTRSIKELAPKPSDAIKAMLTGLRELPNEKFQVDMSTFGTWRNGICFGCAATCAVYQLTGRKPSVAIMGGIDGQARQLGLNYEMLFAFEDAIDLFRCGNPQEVLYFYGLEPEGGRESLWSRQDWLLGTDNWEGQLPLIEAYVQKLEAAGL